MKRSWMFGGMLGLSLLTGGCAFWNSAPADEPTPPVRAAHTATPVKIDGVLDDAVWQTAIQYPMDWSPNWNAGQPPRTLAQIGDTLRESGTVQVAWDDDYLYVAFACNDSDVIAQVTKDQTMLFTTGDVGEVFVKPANDTYYWELYATPSGNQSSWFFPARGHSGLPDMKKTKMPGLKTAAAIDGTLNNWQDVDVGWTAEMAIPRAELEQYGMKFDAETPWTIFFGRYNYSRYLPIVENSSYPVPPNLSYHLIEYYAPLLLEP